MVCMVNTKTIFLVPKRRWQRGRRTWATNYIQHDWVALELFEDSYIWGVWNLKSSAVDQRFQVSVFTSYVS